ITLKVAQQVLGTATNQSVINLVDMIKAKDTRGALDQLHIALDSGTDPRQFARQMVDYLRGLLLIQLGDERSLDVTDEIRKIMVGQPQEIPLTSLTELVKIFNNAANESRLAWQPSLALELAIAQGIQLFNPTPSKSIPHIEVLEEEKKAESKGKIKKSEAATKQEPQLSKHEVDEVFEAPIKHNVGGEDSGVDDSIKKNDASIDIVEVRESLTEVKNLIRNHRKNTEALLASARNFSLKDGVILIGFQSPVLKERVEKGDHQDIIQRAFSHILGKEVRVRAVLINSKSNAADYEDEFEPNSLVSAALDLGGKIVDKE
ncbi:MAG TPA: hypothetical protein VK856_14330, partial [Anaerolineaceae bacterium]|nr:hypothetical protein [Anaerolineaceae bacterium]